MPCPSAFMLEDLRYAVRSVTRARGLTAVLVLSLALGIGANATVCWAVYALLIRAPAGVEDAGALVAVYTSEFSGAPYGRTSGPDYRALATVPSFDGVAAADDNMTANVSFGAVSSLVRTAAVTSNYFDLLRMAPHAGRLLTDADNTATPRGAVISAALADRFGGIDTILGQTIDTGSERFTVVGVTPPKFRGLQASRVTDVWFPMPVEGAVDRGDRRLFVIPRRSCR